MPSSGALLMAERMGAAAQAAAAENFRGMPEGFGAPADGFRLPEGFAGGPGNAAALGSDLAQRAQLQVRVALHLIQPSVHGSCTELHGYCTVAAKTCLHMTGCSLPSSMFSFVSMRVLPFPCDRPHADYHGHVQGKSGVSLPQHPANMPDWFPNTNCRPWSGTRRSSGCGPTRWAPAARCRAPAPAPPPAPPTPPYWPRSTSWSRPRRPPRRPAPPGGPPRGAPPSWWVFELLLADMIPRFVVSQQAAQAASKVGMPAPRGAAPFLVSVAFCLACRGWYNLCIDEGYLAAICFRTPVDPVAHLSW